MLEGLKKAFSFHWSDVLGLAIGGALVSSCSDSELFDLIISPFLYLFALLLVVLANSIIWALGYHGEIAYLKGVFLGIFKSYIRLVLAILSTVGVYFFIHSFF